MSYTTRAKIEADIPSEFLTQALDDNGDDLEDDGLLDTVLASADEEIDSYLEGRYTLPITPAPKLLASAAKVFVLETLYARRGYSADTDPVNPWAGRASAYRTRLKAIAKGDEALRVNTDKAEPSVTVISEPARTHSSGNRLQA